MAPELRPRKSAAPLSKVAQVEKPATPKPAKAQKPAKRKATEDDSPATTKKQKSVKTPKAKTPKKVEEPVVETPAADPPAPKSSTAKSPAAKTAKSPVVKAPSAKSPAAKAPAAKSPAAKSPAAKASTAKSPATKSPATKSPATKSPATKTKKTKKDEPEEIVEDEEKVDAVEEDNHPFSDEEVDEQTKALVLSIDNGDEEEQVPKEADAFKQGQDVGEIPKLSNKERKALKAAAKEKEETGVLYIGRLPHGFYEHELKSYFSQFGPISNLRLSRNKKSGKSKHFAFVEFEELSTAEIVAKTMDHYLLFGHILRCSVIPKAQVHESLFKGANRRYKNIPNNKMEGKRMERPQLVSKWEAKVAGETKKRAAKTEKLKALGYEFNGPELKSAVASAKAAAAAKALAATEEPQEEAPKAIEAPTEAPAEEAAPVVEEVLDVVMTEEVVEEVPVVPEVEEQATPKPVKKTRAKTPKSEEKVMTVTSEKKVTRTRKAKA